MGINHDAAAARERYRGVGRSNPGQWGDQPHTAPDGPLSVDAEDGLHWGPEQVAAASYEPSFRLGGFAVDPSDDEYYGDLAQGMRWAHEHGDRPEDLRYLRRYAGQVDDTSFRELYARAVRTKNGKKFWEDEDEDEYENWKLAIATASQRASGEVADDFLTRAGMASEGYMGDSPFEDHLTSAAHRESNADIGKRIREGMKRAKDAGYLPKHLKISVRMRRGMSGYYVSAVLPDNELYRPATHPWETPREDPWRVNPFGAIHTKQAEELARRLLIVTNRHASESTSPQGEHFRSHNASIVRLDSPDEEARVRRAEELRKCEAWRAEELRKYKAWRAEMRH